MDKYGIFVLWVYGVTLITLLGYVLYLWLNLKEHQ